MEEEELYLCLSCQLAKGRVIISVKKKNRHMAQMVLCEFKYILQITKHQFVFLNSDTLQSGKYNLDVIC